MDTSENVRQWLLGTLPYDRSDANIVAELTNSDTHGLLVRYLNWQSRVIAIEPRVVYKSKAYERNPLVPMHQNELLVIVRDIEQGNDLKKYLSKDVDKAVDVTATKLGRRGDLDLMLNSQNVHHLHVSTKLEADGFVARSGPLLFAVFKPGKSFLIDIMEHGNWASNHVLYVLSEEWPEERLAYEIKGIHPAFEYTEEDRLKLQKVGLNTFAVIDNKVVVPSSVLTTAGTSASTTFTAGNILRSVQNYHQATGNVDWTFEIRGRDYGIVSGAEEKWITLGSY